MVLGVKWLLVAEMSLGEKHHLRENESILGENGIMFFLSASNLGGAEKPVQIPAEGLILVCVPRSFIAVTAHRNLVELQFCNVIGTSREM